VTADEGALPDTWRDIGDYQPVRVDTPQKVLDNDRTKVAGGWADPEHVPALELARRGTLAPGGQLSFDDDGWPLNPAGPTGRRGRVLGKWGPNQAADAIVFRRAAGGGLELLVIRRRSGEWALPGGMVDAGEEAVHAATRELEEETGVVVDMARGRQVFAGVVASDPRNTDNAWMETTAFALVLPDDEAAALTPRAADDATETRWMPVTREEVDALYADHGALVGHALAALDEELGG